MSKNSLFDWDDTDDSREEWRGMPEFNQPDNGAYRQIIISFEDEEAVSKFAKLLGTQFTEKTKSIWFPHRERNNVADLFWFDKSTKDQEKNNE
jgi:hypothetical protein